MADDSSKALELITLYSRFGSFINLYAITESHLGGTLRFITKLDDEVSRAIFGGMRVSDMVSAIKRICKPPRVTEDAAAEIDTIFAQLSHITKLRDALIHRGWSEDGDIFISSNEHSAKATESIEILRWSERDLLDAFSDLGHIILRLRLALNPHDHIAYTPQPWRYKPRPLERPHQSSQKGSRSQ